MVFYCRVEAKENSDICKLGCRGIWLVWINRMGWGKPIVCKQEYAQCQILEKSVLESSTSPLPPFFLPSPFFSLSLSLKFPFQLRIYVSLQYIVSFSEVAVTSVDRKIMLRKKTSSAFSSFPSHRRMPKYCKHGEWLISMQIPPLKVPRF